MKNADKLGTVDFSSQLIWKFRLFQRLKTHRLVQLLSQVIETVHQAGHLVGPDRLQVRVPLVGHLPRPAVSLVQHLDPLAHCEVAAEFWGAGHIRVVVVVVVEGRGAGRYFHGWSEVQSGRCDLWKQHTINKAI